MKLLQPPKDRGTKISREGPTATLHLGGCPGSSRPWQLCTCAGGEGADRRQAFMFGGFHYYKGVLCQGNKHNVEMAGSRHSSAMQL